VRGCTCSSNPTRRMTTGGEQRQVFERFFIASQNHTFTQRPPCILQMLSPSATLTYNGVDIQWSKTACCCRQTICLKRTCHDISKPLPLARLSTPHHLSVTAGTKRDGNPLLPNPWSTLHSPVASVSHSPSRLVAA
jgi:hypothetical protein